MLGAVFVLGGLALSGRMSTPVATALLILFFMLSIDCYLATYTRGEFRLSFDPSVRLNCASFWRPATRSCCGSRAPLCSAATCCCSTRAASSELSAWRFCWLRRSRAIQRSSIARRSVEPSDRTLLRRWTTRDTGTTRGARGAVARHGRWSCYSAGGGGRDRHNFLWHQRWTWCDRHGSFWRFNATTGVISILGNTVLTVFLVRLGLPVVAANAVAIAICSAATYLAANRVAFRAIVAGPDTLPDKHQCAACSPSSSPSP